MPLNPQAVPARRRWRATDSAPLLDFSMAFQPIVDLERRSVFGYEALVRGPEGQPAAEVLEAVDEQSRYRFDQACWVRSIELAAELGLEQRLSINFLPNAVAEPESCIRRTLEATARCEIPPERILFEVTEGEEIADLSHLLRIFEAYRQLGFGTAIDDFGSGYSGLKLLAELQPDFLKLDGDLVRSIDEDRARQAILSAVLAISRDLEITVIAEGVEHQGEVDFLREAGIRYFQGYLFARPGFQQLPAPSFPEA